MSRSTRHVLLVIVPIAAALGAVGACASPFAPKDAAEAGSDSGSTSDATGAADASNPSDAGLAPTPGVVECFVDECAVNSRPVCCRNRDAGTMSCMTQCRIGDLSFKCDDQTDCAPGEVCCVGGLGNATCETSCNGEQLCRADDQCAKGSSCVPVPCLGKVIGACGPVGPYVKELCSSP